VRSTRCSLKACSCKLCHSHCFDTALTKTHLHSPRCSKRGRSRGNDGAVDDPLRIPLQCIGFLRRKAWVQFKTHHSLNPVRISLDHLPHLGEIVRPDEQRRALEVFRLCRDALLVDQDRAEACERLVLSAARSLASTRTEERTYHAFIHARAHVHEVPRAHAHPVGEVVRLLVGCIHEEHRLGVVRRCGDRSHPGCSKWTTEGWAVVAMS
jgi:hypothetical protein